MWETKNEKEGSKRGLQCCLREKLDMQNPINDFEIQYVIIAIQFPIIALAPIIRYTWLMICLSIRWCHRSIRHALRSSEKIIYYYYFFFDNTQTYNNTPTPKLLAVVRVTKLLIYSRTPSKLGDVRQSPHRVVFFFFFFFYNTQT